MQDNSHSVNNYKMKKDKAQGEAIEHALKPMRKERPRVVAT
jgi:hypothetical protein